MRWRERRLAVSPGRRVAIRSAPVCYNSHMEFHGREFRFTRASDLVRDGMTLECDELGPTGPNQVLEAFWCDADGRFTFTAFEHDFPFELVEAFGRVAREGLPPIAHGKK